MSDLKTNIPMKGGEQITGLADIKVFFVIFIIDNGSYVKTSPHFNIEEHEVPSLMTRDWHDAMIFDTEAAAFHYIQVNIRKYRKHGVHSFTPRRVIQEKD